ncbi:LAME_0G12112g1_1 [Lachancea meyersii CBS 8951]|uniref:LAME_0G12112g1_1 n=1 Tax=Lachancea meyersii CBS 8951 TaxID=1266667 RepID=A0A1G4K9J4_9SACH|nr:LAME_0G12112g1_1 [Lachancea meyersii CBS 8951]
MALASIAAERLARQKHQKYFERHLLILPSKYQDNEPNKLAIVTYALIGLSILGVDTSKKYQGSIAWLLEHQRHVSYEECSIAGFIPSLSTNIEEAPSLSLMSTLFGLWGLICLGARDSSVFKDIDLQGIGQFVSKCQCDNGSFVSNFDVLPSSEIHRSCIDPTDLRYSYAAVTILHLIGCRKSEDFSRYISIENLIEFIKTQTGVNGGFGQYNEAHAGLTSCALSILDMLNDQWDCLSARFFEQTAEWLLQRQVSNQGAMTLMIDKNECYDPEDQGGFQGRENKFADTCYGFWCLNSLSILQAHTDVKFDCGNALSDYLLDSTQNKLLGGFAKNNEDDPDLYHSCLGLAALSLNADEFNGTLFLPRQLSENFLVPS